MIRSERFTLSKRPYAVRLDSLRVKGIHPDGAKKVQVYRIGVDVAWFRRRNGVTYACVGVLADIQRTYPADAYQFVTEFSDKRYGATCQGRWDGDRYWGSQQLDEMQQHLETLRPMLDEFPSVPNGYDGWWS